MRFNPPNPAGKRARAAFTLAEVLAALVFMAIVIPVAVEGLRIASLAAVVGERKTAAIRVAERVLNEWLVTGSSAQGMSDTGTVSEGSLEFRWSVATEQWPEADMQQVIVRVVYDAQGREYDVRLDTLMSNSTL